MTNLLYKASIVTTPTAYGVGVLNSIKPAYALGENLVTNGDFVTDSNWTKGTGWTISGGKANCDGSQSSQSNLYQTGIVPINKTYKVTFTIVVNAGSMVLAIGGSNAQPTVSSSGTYTFTSKATSGDSNLYFSASSDFVGSIDNVSVKKVTDADFDFTRTSSATRVNPDYLIETSVTNTPRLDYTNGTASILLEPQSTNLITYSQDFSDSSWTKTNATITSDSITSPEGIVNADKINISSDLQSGIRLFTQINNQEYNISAFVKKGSLSIVQFYVIQQGVAEYTFDINLINGTLGTIPSGLTNAKIENYGNDWYRVSCNRTFTASASNHGIGIVTNNGNGGNYYVWGFQLEEQSYATSYIPTTSGSAVTRAAETLNNAANSDLINSTEGVLYAEMAALADDSTNRNITLSDGTSTNRIVLKYDNQSNVIQSFNRVGGVETAFLGATVSDITQFSKIAVKFKENDYALWIDGVEVDADNSSTTFSANTLNDLSLTPDLYARVKCLAVFKEALSDTELACLTSTNNREIFLNYYYRMQYVGANTEALNCAQQTFNV